MFTKKKIVTVSWLVGGLSLAGVGVGHAYAAGTAGECTRDEQGGVTCVSKTENSYVSEDGRYHLVQKQECSETGREVVDTPEAGKGQLGTTQIGSAVSCSNSVPAPQGFTVPDFSR